MTQKLQPDHGHPLKTRLICAPVLWLIFWLATPGAHAGSVGTALAKGTGEGISRAEAVQNALVEACGSAFGESVRAEMVSASRSLAQRTSGEGTKTSITREINEVVQRRIATSDNTPVLGYQVDDARPSGNGLWTATVTMRYAVYESKIPKNERRNLVVLAEGDASASNFASAVQQGLVSSRRFNVLERGEGVAFFDESQFLLSASAARGERARLGHAEGADYLVVTKVTNVRVFQTAPRINSLTGDVAVTNVLSAEFEVKVLEFSSRRVKWSRTGPLQLEDASGLPPDPAAMLASAGAGLAQSLSKQITDAIYPLRIIRPAGIYGSINQGAGVVEIGDTYDVFQLGADLRDPQSGESLGRAENWIGQAVVRHVKPKYSDIQMVSGSLNASGAEYLARAIDAAGVAKAAERAQVQEKVRETREMTDIFLRRPQ
jgi:hypothetical protein